MSTLNRNSKRRDCSSDASNQVMQRHTGSQAENMKKKSWVFISCLRTPNSWASYFSGHPASCCVQRPSGKQKLSKIWQTCPGWHPMVGLVPTSSRFPTAIASKRVIHTSSWTKHVNLWNIYENNCASNNATSHFFAQTSVTSVWGKQKILVITLFVFSCMRGPS